MQKTTIKNVLTTGLSFYHLKQIHETKQPRTKFVYVIGKKKNG